MEILKEYFKQFNEFPYLLTSTSYQSDEYEFLMINAITRGTPLTEEEISKYFHNKYDVVTNNKQFTNFDKKGE